MVGWVLPAGQKGLKVILLTILTRVVCIAIIATFVAAVGLVIASNIRECTSDVVYCHSCGRAYRNPSRTKRIDWYLTHNCTPTNTH